MQVEAAIRPSEERPRDGNVKVRQDDAEKEGLNSSSLQRTFIPSCFIFKNCRSKSSNNWQWLFLSDLFLLHISLFPPSFTSSTALLFVTALPVQTHSLPVFVFPHTQSQFHPFDLNLPIGSWMAGWFLQAGSYRLLLHFPLMTFQPTLVGQCVELMMHKHTICHTLRNTRWRWSGAACRLPGALSKSSSQGKRRDLQCLE